MNETNKKTKRLAIILGLLQFIIGLGALVGGLVLVLEPNGSMMGLSLKWLEGTPFTNYLIPGTILFLVNGIGSLVGAVASFLRYHLAGEIAMLLGAGLMIWILVQVTMIEFTWLQPTYFILGLLEFLLGWMLRRSMRTGYV